MGRHRLHQRQDVRSPLRGNAAAELAQTYVTAPDRVANRATINAKVAEWVGSHSFDEVMERTRAGEVPCGQIYSIKDIFADPHYAERENLLRVDDERAGPLVLPSAVPRLFETRRRSDTPDERSAPTTRASSRISSGSAPTRSMR